MVNLGDITKFSPEFQKVLVAVAFSGIFWYICLFFAEPKFFHTESKDIVIVLGLGLSFCDLLFNAVPYILFRYNNLTDTEILRRTSIISIIITILIIADHTFFKLNVNFILPVREFDLHRVIEFKFAGFIGVFISNLFFYFRKTISSN